MSSDDEMKKLQDPNGLPPADGLEEDDDSKIFPQRLMEILSDERYHESICWLPHGRAFIIRNRKLFAATVMPRYFSRKAKYSSFTRKLNRWNFVRVSSGPELGAYYHEFFLRDKPHLAAQMFCKNARTMLAMATSSEVPGPNEQPAPETLSPMQQHPQQQQMPQPQPMPNCGMNNNNPNNGNPNNNNNIGDTPMHPALLAAFTKGPTGVNANNNIKGALLGSYPSNSLQFLERQMQALQQEQANYLIMEQAMAMSIQQRQQQQHPQQPPPQHAAMVNQQARLLQMRELMEIRMRQRKGRVPTNHRASAA